MCPASAVRVSELLLNWGHGNTRARGGLTPPVYSDICRLAHRNTWQEHRNRTLPSGPIVYEAYLRLLYAKPPPRYNPSKLFAIAAQLMRGIEVDYARSRRSPKRCAGTPRLAPDSKIAPTQKREVDFVAPVDVLTWLTTLYPKRIRLIEPRFFGGISIENATVVLGISPTTGSRGKATAQAWLQWEMEQKEARK
jgi:RNA polymerase sigma factor (TIGR02999 family)